MFDLILVVAIVTNGLLAGLFFAFTCAISPAFRRVDDATYVSAFRAINAAILNGWFLTVFFVAPLSSLVSSVFVLWKDGSASVILVLAGAVCSALTFGITAAANVPLNRLLEQSPTGTIAQQTNARRDFEDRWNRWNLARTLTSSGTLAFLAAALAG
ncbi:DUF1772 domain-containing protein [Neomicrococcus aestuarii]|uniref:Putative membrane protein n=1 Tax=Neomicrococcus aestuarii TaxID=556325 RepID=A0A1L2ZN82_9MICC|nr:anthrone oxygenase family protein [Neomicrococcus aestuarii]APF40844.1 hypothetical protein BHE16_07255 [Neomicrococcus aestuarii]MBB5512610.1 putative membrane protein [Neomicrococcus aestuarii]